MQGRAWLGLVFAVLVGSCGKDRSLLDGGLGDGNGTNGGTGQVRVRGITPARGPLAGGTSVVIDGQGFVALDAGMPIVVLGDRVATNVAVVDDFTITATAPPGVTPAGVDVIVANKNGYGLLGSAYTYNPLPTVTSVSPPRGDQAGGTHVTITGSGFQQFDAGTNTVTFGDLVAKNVVVVSDTSMTADTPPGAPFQAVDVAVVNTNGASTPATKAYQYSAKGLIVGIAFSQPGGGLYYVDPTTGLSTKVMVTLLDNQPIGFHSLATDSQGLLWGITKGGPANAHLVSIDPYAQIVTDKGELIADTTSGGGSGTGALNISCGDLEFVGDRLYCSQASCCQGPPMLYTVDTANGAATHIVLTNQGGLGVAELGGVSYGTSKNNRTIGVLDLNTAGITNPVAITYTPPGGTAQPVALIKSTGFAGKVYGFAGGGGGSALPTIPGAHQNFGISNRTIYGVDPATGTATLIGAPSINSISMTKLE